MAARTGSARVFLAPYGNGPEPGGAGVARAPFPTRGPSSFFVGGAQPCRDPRRFPAEPGRAAHPFPSGDELDRALVRRVDARSSWAGALPAPLYFHAVQSRVRRLPLASPGTYEE